MKTKDTFRASLSAPKQEKENQTFHPNHKSAKAWARKVLVPGASVEIYRSTETLVEVLTHE